jgi:hypothetical protein
MNILLVKYASDTNILVPKITDFCFTYAFNNIEKWAHDNRMIFNLSKTKEIVFHRPNPHHSFYREPLADIGQVHETKLLGICLES